MIVKANKQQYIRYQTTKKTSWTSSILGIPKARVSDHNKVQKLHFHQTVSAAASWSIKHGDATGMGFIQDIQGVWKWDIPWIYHDSNPQIVIWVGNMGHTHVVNKHGIGYIYGFMNTNTNFRLRIRRFVAHDPGTYKP